MVTENNNHLGADRMHDNTPLEGFDIMSPVTGVQVWMKDGECASGHKGKYIESVWTNAAGDTYTTSEFYHQEPGAFQEGYFSVELVEMAAFLARLNNLRKEVINRQYENDTAAVKAEIISTLGRLGMKFDNGLDAAKEMSEGTGSLIALVNVVPPDLSALILMKGRKFSVTFHDPDTMIKVTVMSAIHASKFDVVLPDRTDAPLIEKLNELVKILKNEDNN